MKWWAIRRRSWIEATYWAVDLETTGLKSRRDRILSIGMVPIVDGVIRWGDRLYTTVSGGDSSANSGALGVHQILPGDITSAPGEAEILDFVLPRLAGNVLLAHHAVIEVRFLKAASRRCGLRWPQPAVVDTMRLIDRLQQRMERLQPYTQALPRGLSEARERLGLPGHRAHHALADALATAELFLALRNRLDVRRLRQLVRS